MDVIKWQLIFGSCNFGPKSYLWFQIKLALCARLILKSRVWFQTKLPLHSVQLPLLSYYRKAIILFDQIKLRYCRLLSRYGFANLFLGPRYPKTRGFWTGACGRFPSTVCSFLARLKKSNFTLFFFSLPLVLVFSFLKTSDVSEFVVGPQSGEYELTCQNSSLAFTPNTHFSKIFFSSCWQSFIYSFLGIQVFSQCWWRITDAN